jgi:hypothetical protein
MWLATRDETDSPWDWQPYLKTFRTSDDRGRAPSVDCVAAGDSRAIGAAIPTGGATVCAASDRAPPQAGRAAEVQACTPHLAGGLGRASDGAE